MSCFIVLTMKSYSNIDDEKFVNSNELTAVKAFVILENFFHGKQNIASQVSSS